MSSADELIEPFDRSVEERDHPIQVLARPALPLEVERHIVGRVHRLDQNAPRRQLAGVEPIFGPAAAMQHGPELREPWSDFGHTDRRPH